MAKKTKIEVNELNIFSYTTDDKEFVFAHAKKNREGFPVVYPVKNGHNRRIALSFVDAHIQDLDKNEVASAIGNFDIMGDEVFDQNDPLAAIKLEYISAIMNPRLRVKGGVYYHGKILVDKITPTKAYNLMKAFLNEYFHIEDAEAIEATFNKFNPAPLPYYPNEDKRGRRAVFVAHNATVFNKETKPESGPFNFAVYYGELFDLKNEETLKIAKALVDIFDENKIGRGFYYKGLLIDDKLNVQYKLYLERAFLKKNFAIEQRDFLEESFHHDPKTGHLLFFPMRDASGRDIAISALDVEIQGKEGKRDIHLYADKPLELNASNLDDLQIISALYYKKPGYKGALYMDGVLISTLNSSEAERRKSKAESMLKAVISDSEDYSYINRNFTIEDSFRLLRLGTSRDGYYPNANLEVPLVEKNPAKTLHFDRINLIDIGGNYSFATAIDEGYEAGDTLSKEAKAVLEALFDKKHKIRGGLYFEKTAINKARGRAFNKFVAEFLPTLKGIDADALIKSKTNKGFEPPFPLDSRYDVPRYFPSKDKEGREILLSVADADVHFQVGGSVVRAVNNATFNIYEGETFGLVGESGSGKTTISRAILGINKLTRGGIYFRGKLISSSLSKKEKKHNKKDIQMIFQDPAASLNERANVDYIVSEGLYNFHMFKSKQERLDRVGSMLYSVGLLPEHLSRYPHEFSGGQRQRIGIARALILEPRLVLADEPISALDVSIRAQVLNLLKKMQKEQGLTYLFIAHDLSIIRYISDRIAVMHKGYIVELGSAEEIYTNPLHPYTRSLLTAIPQPDPKTKDQRKKIPYDQTGIDYEACTWKEVLPGHFVYLNDMLEEDIKKRLKKNEK